MYMRSSFGVYFCYRQEKLKQCNLVYSYRGGGSPLVVHIVLLWASCDARRSTPSPFKPRSLVWPSFLVPRHVPGSSDRPYLAFIYNVRSKSSHRC